MHVLQIFIHNYIHIYLPALLDGAKNTHNNKINRDRLTKEKANF